MERHLNIAEALLVAWADKDRGDDSSYTPLIRAAEHGHVECLKVLLSAGAAKDKADNYGYTLKWAM